MTAECVGPMSLQSVDWKRRYKSTENRRHLLDSFFLPALRESTVYLRGAGFFSSSMFDAIGSELGDFVERGGKMRILASVVISEKDREAIKLGLKQRNTVTEEELARIIEEDFRPPLTSGSMMLTRLLELGRLEIKIGVKNPGMYHEKIGIFFDYDIDLDAKYDDLVGYDHLAFFGSVNEGVTAWQLSHENIKVYPSWNEKRSDDANDTLEDFIQNWNGKTPGLEVIDFPEAMRKELLRIRKDTRTGNYEDEEEIDSTESDNTDDIPYHATENVWVEKTRVKGKAHRISGSRALGRMIWSPRRSKSGQDIYRLMREVSKGDRIIHLVNDTTRETYISGVSIVGSDGVERIEFDVGSEWDGEVYSHKLENYLELESRLYREDILSEDNRGELDEIRAEGKVFYTKGLELRQGHYLTPCSPKMVELFNEICLKVNDTPLPHLGERTDFDSPREIGTEIDEVSIEEVEDHDPRYDFQDDANTISTIWLSMNKRITFL